MMGEAFARKLNQYMKCHGWKTSSIGVIASRPHQSKHLETATVTILDRRVDFVNLRCEVYAEDSRIPSEVTFGTPMEDAHRRDITINALYYNIHTGLVEDYTNKVSRSPFCILAS